MKTIKGKPLVGLDIGSHFIKAVELVYSPRTNEYAISSYAFQEITPGEDLDITLQKMWEANELHTNKVVTAISGRSVIVRYITMPEMAPDELKNAIQYEATKYIPFEIDEVMIDCLRLPDFKKEAKSGGDAPKEMPVLLVAAKKDKLNEHIDILEKSGLWPIAIDVDCFALGNSFELKQIITNPTGSPEKVSALIDIGAIKTNVTIMSGLQVSFTREIYVGGKDFTEAISKKMSIPVAEAEKIKRNPGVKADEVKDYSSSLLEDLIHEIKLSFDYFEHQFDRPIYDIYLSGGSALLFGLDRAIESAFTKKPTTWNPCESLEIMSTKIDPVELKKKASQLVIATGLAARIKKD